MVIAELIQVIPLQVAWLKGKCYTAKWLAWAALSIQSTPPVLNPTALFLCDLSPGWHWDKTGLDFVHYHYAVLKNVPFHPCLYEWSSTLFKMVTSMQPWACKLCASKVMLVRAGPHHSQNVWYSGNVWVATLAQSDCVNSWQAVIYTMCWPTWGKSTLPWSSGACV